MTIEEMAQRIKNWCKDRDSCKGCPLFKSDDPWCYNYGFEDGRDELGKLKKHYEILFGGETQMKQPASKLTADQK